MSKDDTTDNDKFEQFLANISVNADETGMHRTIHPERALQYLAAKEKKLREKEKSFNRFIGEIDRQIALLRNQLANLENERNEILEEMADLEKGMPKNEDGTLNWEEIAGKEGIERKEGETPEEFKKRAIKELQAKKDRGELDPNSKLALWLDANNRLGIVDGKITITKKEIDNLNKPKANSAVTTAEIKDVLAGTAALKEKIAADPKNPALVQELVDLNDRIEAVETNTKEREATFKGAYENDVIFAKLGSENSPDADKLVLDAMSVSDEEKAWVGGVEGFGLFEDKPELDNQITAANAVSENPIKPESGKLTDTVNLAFNPESAENFPDAPSPHGGNTPPVTPSLA